MSPPSEVILHYCINIYCFLEGSEDSRMFSMYAKKILIPTPAFDNKDPMTDCLSHCILKGFIEIKNLSFSVLSSLVIKYSVIAEAIHKPGFSLNEEIINFDIPHLNIFMRSDILIFI